MKILLAAQRTSDLLRWTRFRDVSELRWKERKSVSTSAGKIDIAAYRVKHWGARTLRDTYRGYNGYVFERNNRRIIFGGDTALSGSFAERASGHRFGDYADRRLRSLDSFALHSGTSRAHGQ